MSTIWIIVLFMVAFFETMFLFINPVSDIKKMVKEKELEERSFRTRQETILSQAEYKGCFGCVSMLISRVNTIVIIPAFTITAILKNVGYQPFSFIHLFVILITWVFLLTNYYRKPRTNVSSNEKDDEAETETDITKQIEEPKLSIKIFSKVITVIQSAYLWYLFLVLIKFIK